MNNISNEEILNLYDNHIKIGEERDLVEIIDGKICVTKKTEYSEDGVCKIQYGPPDSKIGDILISDENGNPVRKCRNKLYLNNIKNRFYSKVTLPNKQGCMIWMGETETKRDRCLEDCYGYFYEQEFTFEPLKIKAHEYSYELFIGKKSINSIVKQECGNPYCLAPDHLYLQENI